MAIHVIKITFVVLIKYPISIKETTIGSLLKQIVYYSFANTACKDHVKYLVHEVFNITSFKNFKFLLYELVKNKFTCSKLNIPFRYNSKRYLIFK